MKTATLTKRQQKIFSIIEGFGPIEIEHLSRRLSDYPLNDLVEQQKYRIRIKRDLESLVRSTLVLEKDETLFDPKSRIVFSVNKNPDPQLIVKFRISNASTKGDSRGT